MQPSRVARRLHHSMGNVNRSRTAIAASRPRTICSPPIVQKSKSPLRAFAPAGAALAADTGVSASEGALPETMMSTAPVSDPPESLTTRVSLRSSNCCST